MASKGKILRIVAVLTLAAIATTSLYQVVPAAVADFATLKARYEIERLRDGQRPMPTLPAWAQLRDDLAQAASWVPDNPRWYDDLGFLYVLRARNTPNVPELAALRRNLYAEAADQYRQAARLRPMFPFGWANLALAKHYADQDDEELWSAFDKAFAYGHHEVGVQRMLAELAFARWSTLSAERAAAVTAMIAETRADLRQPLLDLAKRYAVDLPSGH